MGYVTNQNVNLQLMILLNFTIHHSCMIWGGEGRGIQLTNYNLNMDKF
jgi:hypothetical protein